MAKKNKKSSAKYHVSKEHWTAAKAGMDQVLQKLDLKFALTASKRTGDLTLRRNTVAGYEKHYRGLRHFFCLIGDYESLLILQENAPTPFCPSMSAVNLALFIKWKRGEKGTPLLRLDASSVSDIFGMPIACEGGWNDPKNVQQFNSAVVAVHGVHEQRGQYQEKCTKCIELENSGDGYMGCRIHRGSPCIWRKGCPVQSGSVKNAVARSSKDGEEYTPLGDSPLTPMELLQLRATLLSTNSIADYQFFVLLLLSIKLFLRSGEATGDQKAAGKDEAASPTGLTIASIDPSLCCVENGILKSVAVVVKGTINGN
jgi:hypothetical protein